MLYISSDELPRVNPNSFNRTHVLAHGKMLWVLSKLGPSYFRSTSWSIGLITTICVVCTIGEV